MNLHTANIKFLQTNNDFVASEGSKTKQVLTDETITTVSLAGLFQGQFAYSTFINEDKIVVTFDGTEYTCQKIVGDETNVYGGFGSDGPDFSEYPFFIESDAEEGNRLYTQTAGTYTVKIETMA